MRANAIAFLEQAPLGPVARGTLVAASQRFRWENISTPVEIELRNTGETDLTFAVHQSADDAVADPYAAMTLRVGVSDVTSVVVVPGGVVTATIPAFGVAPSTVKSWLKVLVSETVGQGDVTLRGLTGRLWRAALHATTVAW